MISSSKPYFAYCSALAIYIHELPSFQCVKVLSPQYTDNFTFISISFHPTITTRIASISNQRDLIIWDTEQEKEIYHVSMDGDGKQIEWSRFDTNILLLSFDNGII